jgi:hypothetical protein
MDVDVSVFAGQTSLSKANVGKRREWRGAMRPVEVVPRSGPRPAIRVRPVPHSDPPFDDELSPEIWAPAHQLAFAWPAREQPAREQPAREQPAREQPAGLTPPSAPSAPSAPATGGRGSNGRPAAGAQALSGPSVVGVRTQGGQPTAGAGTLGGQAAAGSLAAGGSSAVSGMTGGRMPHAQAAVSMGGVAGDAKLAVRRFVGTCVEVLNGYRPAAHLRRLALPMEAAGVVAQGVSGARRVAELRRASRGGNRCAARPGPVAVVRIRLCEPRPGAVEAAVLLVTGERTWAMAVRLELHQQNWAATVLRLI